MTAVSDADAVVVYPELRWLIALREAGWQFMPVTDDDGLKAVEGYRALPGGYREALRVRSSTDTLGLRCNPLGEVVWQLTGTLVEVVDLLRGLPAPDHRLAPHLVKTTIIRMTS